MDGGGGCVGVTDYFVSTQLTVMVVLLLGLWLLLGSDNNESWSCLMYS